MADEFVCKYCQKNDFKNKKSLSNHRRYHEGFKLDCKGIKNVNDDQKG